jgi:hypothetical protein
MAVFLSLSGVAYAQELTAEQRSACMGDYEKFCKGVEPGAAGSLRVYRSRATSSLRIAKSFDCCGEKVTGQACRLLARKINHNPPGGYHAFIPAYCGCLYGIFNSYHYGNDGGQRRCMCGRDQARGMCWASGRRGRAEASGGMPNSVGKWRQSPPLHLANRERRA